MRPHYQISKFVSLRGALVHGTSFLSSSKTVSRKDAKPNQSKLRKARKEKTST